MYYQNKFPNITYYYWKLTFNNSSFENILVILEGNIDINLDALCGAAFPNKGFVKDSHIRATLEEIPLVENNPIYHLVCYIIDNKIYNNCLLSTVI